MRKIGDDGRATIREWSGALPSHLFRYRSLDSEKSRERVREILVDSKLYYGRFKDMNDPFEGRMLPDFSGSSEEVREYWKNRPDAMKGLPPEFRDKRLEELVAEASGGGPFPKHEEVITQFVNELGLCCFVGSGQDIPMWAYYGDSHKGVCLRFRFDEKFLAYTSGEAPPIPVKYLEEYPRPRFYDESVVDLVTGLVSTKAVSWVHEREWRIVTMGGVGSRSFPPEILDGVILGERISEENAALIRQWVKERKTATHLLQAHSSDTRFAVELRPTENL